MIHVPDVRATVNWYQELGFNVNNTYGNEGDGLSFAVVSFGDSRVMFNQGGRTSEQRRREVDLYIYTNNVDGIYQRLKDSVEVIEAPHDTFYGMRELIIRDLNRFWITFGQVSFFEMLMAGVSEGNVESVRTAIDRGQLKPEMLSTALIAASAGDNKNTEIVAMLKAAGALSPTDVDAELLQSHAGKYKGDRDLEFTVTVDNGRLFAAMGNQEPLGLIAVDKTTFRPIALAGVTLTFDIEGGKTIGAKLQHGPTVIQLNRVE